MSLIDIKQHMMRVKMATLGSLCILFKVEPDTLRSLLQHWMRKGKIRQCMKEPACGSRCFKCPGTTTEIYEWVM
jgi:putative ferrous iron transport protein C